jgi:thioesterase domain-containing protein
MRLAKLLPDEVPVYGLQTPGLHEDLPIYSTAHEMSGVLVDAIREVQPGGPYRIVGWSAGGVIAFDIAQRLASLGETPAHLGLIDTGFWFASTQSEVSLLRKAKSVFENFHDLGVPGLIHGLTPPAKIQFSRNLNDAALAERELQFKQQVAFALQQYRRNEFRGVLASQLIGIAVDHYSPAVYPGKMVLYRTEKYRATQSNRGLFDIQWSRVVRDGVVISELPGNHVSVMFSPQIEILATRLSSHLTDRG